MVATITTNYSSASPNTQTSMVADIQTAMTAAGFSATYDTVVSGSNTTLIHQQQFDPTKGKGTAYIATIVGTDLGVSEQIYDGWDINAHVGSNGGSATDRNVFLANEQITYTSINHPELRLVLLTTASGPVTQTGYFRPATKPSWWDEGLFLYCFYSRNSNFVYYRTVAAGAIPYSDQGGDNNLHRFPTAGYLDFRNPSGRRDILPAPFMAAPTQNYTNGSSYGISGITSGDIALGCCAGLSRLDILAVTPGTSQYLVLGNAGQQTSSPGFLIKIA